MLLLTKKTRTILFWIFVALFFILLLILISFSFGFKISFEGAHPKIQKTGALYLEVEPDDNLLFFLNHKLKTPKKRLFGGYFFENLLPRKYLIEIKKENYFEWKKNIEILPGLVSFAKVKLIKKNLQPQFLFKTTSTLLLFSEKNQKFIFQNKNQLEIFDLKEKKLERKILPKKIIIKKVYPHPFSSKKLLIFGKISKENSTTSIFEFDLFKEKLTHLKTLKTSLNLEINPKNGEYFYFDKNHNLFKENIFHHSKELILSSSSWPLNSTSTFNLKEIKFLNSHFLALNTTLGIFIFDLNSKNFLTKTPIPNAELILIDPNKEKIIFYKENQLKIKYLKKIFSPVIRNQGEIDLLVNWEKIEKIDFYKDQNYLLVLKNKKLFFLELDPRDPINIYPLEENITNFWYLKEKNLLFILKENSFFFYKSL